MYTKLLLLCCFLTTANAPVTPINTPIQTFCVPTDTLQSEFGICNTVYKKIIIDNEPTVFI